MSLAAGNGCRDRTRMPVCPAMRSLAVMAFSDPAGQAPALAQGQGRARPPAGYWQRVSLTSKAVRP